jgi:hypothetical protein
MASYTINNTNAGTQQNIPTTINGTNSAILQAAAATGATTLRRIWWTEFEWGANNVPNATDCPIILDMSKFTAAATATSLTPVPTDTGGGDAVALGTYTANGTTAGTYTASSSVFTKSINQRASDKQWWRDKATCPIIPAVNANGLGIRVYSTNYASTVLVQASVEE